MADLSNPLDQIVVGQSQPAVTANELIDALSPAALFGRRNRACVGLVWGYYGGRYNGSPISNGTITLPASQANNYIVFAKATGVVSSSTGTTNWNDNVNYGRLYWAVTNSTDIIDYDDYREVTHVSVSDLEVIQDIVANLLQPGNGISVTYNDNDSPPTYVISNSYSAPPSTEQIEDIVASLIVAGSNVSVNYNDGDSPASLVIGSTASGGTDTETIQDIIAALLTAGTNISLQYNDGDSPATLVINSSASGGGGPDTETIQDIVASLLTAGSNVTLQYNDGDSPATLVVNSAIGSGADVETIQDIVAALIVGGTGITTQYNDSDSPATLVLTGSSMRPDLLPSCDHWLDCTQTQNLFTAANSNVQVTTDGSSVGFVRCRNVGSSRASNLIVPQCYSQATAGARPLLKTAIVNGKNVLRFDGTDDFLALLDRTVLNDDAIEAATQSQYVRTRNQALIIIAGAIKSAGAAQANAYDNSGVAMDSGGNWGLTASASGSNVTLHGYQFDGATQVATVATTIDTFFVATCRMQLGNVEMRINGGAWNTDTFGTPSPGSLGFQMGRGYGGVRFAGMDVAHLAVYQQAPSDAEILEVERWMGNEIGVSF